MLFWCGRQACESCSSFFESDQDDGCDYRYCLSAQDCPSKRINEAELETEQEEHQQTCDEVGGDAQPALCGKSRVSGVGDDSHGAWLACVAGRVVGAGYGAE